jgi:hypothetical protein
LPVSAARAQASTRVATIATIGEPGPLDPMPFTADIVTEIVQQGCSTLYTPDWKR